MTDQPEYCPPGVHSIFDPCPGDCGKPIDDEDDFTGPLVPPALMDAIRDAEAEQERTRASLDALPDRSAHNAGPSVAEAAADDRAYWERKDAEEGQ
ncbi:hypothetical protein ABZ387_06970 [Streptomyces flaveolus]|uniref:hypothetical protein n=1 Tax=Streptomyces flaveolus TaxID=67297 RepID=UPI0034112CB3